MMAFRAKLLFIGNNLPLLKRSITFRLNHRVVDKNVFAALNLDETITVLVIEPLYLTLFHGIYPPPHVTIDYL